MGHVDTEGRDPLLQRDKGKRKRGWGSVEQEKNLGLGRIQSLTVGLSLDWGRLPCSLTWGVGEPALGSVARSGAQHTVGESDPLPGVLRDRRKTAGTTY